MPLSRKAKIIPLNAQWGSKQAKIKVGEEAVSFNPEQAFLYTIDLLMEDFGKRHRTELCALCNPMKIMGRHRKEVMIELLMALFTTFFPSFENYVSDVKGSLLEGLLDRRDRRTYSNWKEKLKCLLNNQIETDLQDFLRDIENHLAKFSQVSVEDEQHEEILEQALQQIHKNWEIGPD